jgi:hypothetical protein
MMFPVFAGISGWKRTMWMEEKVLVIHGKL